MDDGSTRREWLAAKQKWPALRMHNPLLFAYTNGQRRVMNMENTGVSCDVCACRHNMAGCKCDLPEIRVTEHCTCSTQEIPHFCKSYEEK